MALEQMRAWRARRPLEDLGPTERIEPDGFPLLIASELRNEHQVISDLIRRSGQGYHDATKALNVRPFERMLASSTDERTRFCFALLERTFAFDARLSVVEGPAQFLHSNFFDYGPAAKVMAALFEKGVDAKSVATGTLDWFHCYRFNYYGTPVVREVLAWLSKEYSRDSLPEDWRQKLIALRGQCSDVDYQGSEQFNSSRLGKRVPEDSIEALIDRLIGEGPWLVLVPCEIWTRCALEEIGSLPSDRQKLWFGLLKHCHGANAAKPSGKWLKAGTDLLEKVGPTEFTKTMLDWFPRVNEGRFEPFVGLSWENVEEEHRMHEINARVLRGLLWLCPKTSNSDLTGSIGTLATSAYRKIRGLGPRAVKVGNAAVFALSEIGTPEAVGQLAILQARVKFGTALKEIEKAYNATAERLKIPREELEETAVPTYGLEDVGKRVESLGEVKAELVIDGSDVELKWFGKDGKQRASVPAAAKKEFTEKLKELKGAVKDIERMLGAQRERLDSLFLQEKKWSYPVWRERYLDHPLVGTLARRLIWCFEKDGKADDAIYFNGELIDADGQPLRELEAVTVELWHPIGRSIEEIVGWRSWLEENRVQQPFKQAHREIYVLTEAERRTGRYSNRFAAHILKQHQFNALCALRGWKNQLRLMVDAEYAAPHRVLPNWGLRAEFWVEAIGDDYGRDTNESGVYLYLSTDQVRFYRIEEQEPLPLEEVPPLVFSEIMRDVDLFVGVASVGNDPGWADGGPDGRYQGYWNKYSFGELSTTATTRKEVLERLVPRLKISGCCSFSEKFLVVKGKLRTYKIHLGSGNILMEPNDQYLCIVPKGSAEARGQEIILPFEGDRTLSVILSKAFLLADDAKITDETIVRQIKG